MFFFSKLKCRGSSLDGTPKRNGLTCRLLQVRNSKLFWYVWPPFSFVRGRIIYLAYRTDDKSSVLK